MTAVKGGDVTPGWFPGVISGYYVRASKWSGRKIGILSTSFLRAREEIQVVKRHPSKDVQPKYAKAPKARGKRRRRPSISIDTELPDFYYKTCVVLLSVDPRLVYAYWEVTQRDLERARRSFAREFADARAVLRFHELGSRDKTENEPRNCFDVEVELTSRSMFVPLWSSGKTYQVELGLKGPDDRFSSLAVSNIAGTAPDSVDANTVERFTMVSGDLRIVEISGRIRTDESEHASLTNRGVSAENADLEQLLTAGRLPAPIAAVAEKEALGELNRPKEAAMNTRLKSAEPSSGTFTSPIDGIVKTTSGADRNVGGHRSFSSQQVLERRLSWLSAFRKGRPLQIKKAPEAIHEDHAAYPKSDRGFSADLTERSAKMFDAGISSRRGPRRKE